jgi:DUF4097 and DUF4098 domain-containing protein YvlB
LSRYEREITRYFQTGLAPRLDIKAVNGAITVLGEDRGDVFVRARARFRAHSDEEAADLVRSIEAGIRAEGDVVTVHAPDSGDGFRSGFGFGSDRHLHLDFEVMVPREASLEMVSVNGGVEVRSLGGNATIRMVNGGYHLEGLGGAVSFRSVNGEGAIRDVSGDLEMDYKNGRTSVEHIGGNVTLNALNSRVEITGAGAAVSLRVLNGAVRISGPVGGDVSIDLKNGNIVLIVPPDSRFDFDASSELGAVTSDLPVRETTAPSGEARLPRVKLHTHSGSIRLEVMRQAEAAGVP